MAQDGEVNVKVKVTAENGGVVKSEEGLKRVGSAAKKTAAESKSAFGQMQSSIGKVNGAIGLFRKTLAGFGVIGAITGVITVVDKIRDSFRSAKKEAEEFKKAADEKKLKDGIDALADSYKNLTDSIAKANAERSAENEIEEINLKNKRDLEDANIDLAEQQELDAVDAKDPAAAEARAEIQARYKAKRDNLAVQRGIFDGVRQRQELQQSAIADRKNAADIDTAAARTEAAIEEAKARKSAANLRATSSNDEDATGFLSTFVHNLKSIVTLDWGKVGDDRTTAGDEVRKKAQAEADAEQSRIEQLTATLDAQRKQSEDLRSLAGQKDAKAAALEGSVAAQQMREKIVRMQGDSSVAAAVRATDKKDEETAAKAAKIADAEAAKKALTAQKADIRAKLAAEQERKNAANRSVYEAQGMMDAARLGGNRSAQQSALGNLQSAQRAAQDVNFAADQAITALTTTLKNVEARLKAAQNFLESQSKQQRNAWSEAPAGK